MYPVALCVLSVLMHMILWSITKTSIQILMHNHTIMHKNWVLCWKGGSSKEWHPLFVSVWDNKLWKKRRKKGSEKRIPTNNTFKSYLKKQQLFNEDRTNGKRLLLNEDKTNGNDCFLVGTKQMEKDCFLVRTKQMEKTAFYNFNEDKANGEDRFLMRAQHIKKTVF